MTTPAINNFSFLSGTSRVCTYYGTSPSCNDRENPQAGYSSEIRPESKSIAFREDGWRNCGAWSHYGVEARIGPATVDYTNYGFRTVASGNILAYADIPRTRSFSVNAYEAAYTKALSDAGGNKVQLLQFIAQIQQTVDLIAATILRFSGDVRWFRRRFPRWWAEVLKYQVSSVAGRRRDMWCKIPSRWLEMQYGWIPDMNTIVSAINALAELSKTRLPVVVGTGTFHNNYSGTVRFQTIGWGSTTQPNGIIRVEESARCKLYFGIKDLVLRSSGELGLRNGTGLVWEVLPWSFLLDWVVPIGIWLDALDAPNGLDYIDGCVSQRIRVDAMKVTSPEGTPYTHVNSWKAPNWTHAERHFKRTPIGVLTVPRPYVKSPLSLQHAANALSLLVQAFTGRV